MSIEFCLQEGITDDNVSGDYTILTFSSLAFALESLISQALCTFALSFFFVAKVVEIPLDGTSAPNVRINLAPMLAVVNLIRQVRKPESSQRTVVRKLYGGGASASCWNDLRDLWKLPGVAI